MKKALVFVLVLGFLGTLAFAQNAPALKFNGYANFGATVTSQGSTSQLMGLGSDSWVPGGRFQWEGKYAASNWGWAFRIRQDSWSFSAPTATAADTGVGFPLYLKRAWGWLDFLNNMVTIQAGRLGDYTWSTNGWQSFGNLDGALGLQLQLKPVSGLNLGVFLPTALNGNLTNTASDAFKAVLLGANYTMSDMGYVSLGYDLGAKYFWAGLSYTGMKDLTAIVEMKYNNQTTTASNYFYTDQQIGYSMAPLNFTLWAEEQFNSSSSTNMVLHFQPVIDYTYDMFDLGAFFTFLTDSTSSGYGPGVFVKATVADGATLAIGGEYDLGTAAPATLQPTQNTYVDGMYDPLGGPYPTGALLTQSNPLLRAYVDMVVSF